MQIIKLTSTDFNLDSRISADMQEVLVLLDSTNGSFSVALPDAAGALIDRINFKHAAGSATVTIQSRAMQYIDNLTSYTMNPYDYLTLSPDRERTWWVCSAKE